MYNSSMIYAINYHAIIITIIYEGVVGVLGFRNI